ncbi:glucan endo-1,3-beta-glucosidase [Trifolium pratense]|uniref:Glucan endo-1,3-beta-glucosidase n=1 Tax=Trifolium pratense TaxID=57577 RepID=A0A2K3LJS4_TRIPR|nr:glucan endo-1,3-beta-glucosidase [Trifolium pratense]
MDRTIWQFALFSLCILSGISASLGGGQWCVANKGASNSDLQVALNYACCQGGADCSQIQPGAICYEPNTLLDHASYAFNDYYQKHPIPSSCVFGGTATLTSNDPSHGNCHYASSGSR